ncbi:MAG: PilZ domain-containing protein [Myxococcota bacterium]
MAEIRPPADSALPRRLVLTDAPPESFPGLSRSILAKLGYQIVSTEEFDSDSGHGEFGQPDLRIVDERLLTTIDDDSGKPIPIIVLTGRHGVTGADQRIVGALKRPAGLHELYRLMQQILEDKPRAAPRVPTHIPATAIRDGEEWTVAILSLSESGCLIRSRESLLLGSRIALRFSLPKIGPIEIGAEAGYQLVPDVGLIFISAPPRVREGIASFVAGALAES